MPKFKKGQKVRRLNYNHNGVKVGNVYTVSHYTSPNSLKLKESPGPGGYNEEYFELVNDGWTEGKFIKYKDRPPRKILGVCGEIVFCSLECNHSRNSFSCTKKDLINRGYKLVGEEPETIELSVKEVAEKLNIDPSKLKIIDK